MNAWTHYFIKIRRFIGLPMHNMPLKPQKYTGPFSEGLWGEVERALSYHKKDKTPRRGLNRLAQEEVKRLALPAIPWLDEASCTLSLRQWPLGRILKLPRRHRRDLPRMETGPIIVLQIGHRSLVIDGHTRINKWCTEAPSGKRSVIVMRPTIGRSSADDISHTNMADRAARMRSRMAGSEPA